MCFGPTKAALGLLSMPGAVPEPVHLQSCGTCGNTGASSRQPGSARSSFSLPTIEEDEELRMCGSPTWSSSSSNCSSMMTPPPVPAYPACYSGCGQQASFIDQWQQQQQFEMQMEADELLLAAIDLRLQQLLELRNLRKSALSAGAAPAPAPVPAGAACYQQTSSEAAHLCAAAKVAQLQQVQRMQLALQSELLAMLAHSY